MFGDLDLMVLMSRAGLEDVGIMDGELRACPEVEEKSDV